MKPLQKTLLYLSLLLLVGSAASYGLGMARAASSSTGVKVAPGDVLYANNVTAAGSRSDHSIGVHHGASGPDAAQQDSFANESKALFLSPDRKTVAVTLQPADGEGSVSTYLATPGGSALTEPKPGSFVSWAPDSSRAYLFLPDTQNAAGRAIYEISTGGDYRDAGFPIGTIAVDTNPADGRVFYALTKPGADESNVWVREAGKPDSVFIRGDHQTFVWMRWSPDGKNLAYLAYDNKPGVAFRQSFWVAGPDGTKSKKVDDVLWDYPPVWSPDGSAVAYARPEGDASNIFEYRPATEKLTKITELFSMHALQPSYGSDGALVFLSDQSGAREVWRYSLGTLSQVTKTGTDKQYPVSL